MTPPYKIVPNSPYAVSEEGMVIIFDSKRPLLSTVEKRGKKLLRRVKWGSEYNYVHRLVALAWVEKPTDAGDVVKFKDGNSLNVHADNLYWAKRGPKKGRKSV